jgi:hypothetical protein
MALLAMAMVVMAMMVSVSAQLPFPPGRCEPFAGAPLSQCGAVVNYNVFVPSGRTQQDLDVYVL